MVMSFPVPDSCKPIADSVKDDHEEEDGDPDQGQGGTCAGGLVAYDFPNLRAPPSSASEETQHKSSQEGKGEKSKKSKKKEKKMRRRKSIVKRFGNRNIENVGVAVVEEVTEPGNIATNELGELFIDFGCKKQGKDMLSSFW